MYCKCPRCSYEWISNDSSYNTCPLCNYILSIRTKGGN